ncbi:GGDEF domain-containing protein [Metallumcola ferriviriculae]|uniref:GGDEF domain-containing protein n=1 Tax=Metallumcola ferriviriculae TaxID=3039180 RepID=A0AAU0USR2_9FIRM|nr:GGDEF domain-containing protein [Desulfitibacteraceae bacterium MK1]
MKNIRYIFALSIIIIVYIILLTFFYNNYENTVEIIESEYGAKHKLVEESVYNTIKYADTILGITEQQLNVEMQKKSLILLNKYSEEPDVMTWDLQALKNEIPDCDIYIINEDLKVVRTTFADDLGLDFKEFPTFSKLLDSRLQGNSFVADRLDISTNTGKLMKYSYTPTPDHKYILELSINIEERFPVLTNADIFAVAEQSTMQYPSVENVAIYKTNFGRKSILKISKSKPYYNVVMDNNKLAQIQKALKSDEVQLDNLIDKSSGNSFTHKYIPYVVNTRDGEYSWWNSYVIEVVYNNLGFNELNNQKTVFWKNIGLVTLVYLTFALLILYLLLKSEHMAYHDPLTNLPNRKLFERSINQAIVDAEKNKLKLAVLFLDLDNFKKINDTYGHEVGDSVLKEVTSRLRTNLRESDIVSRLGGDEFTILLSDIKSEDNSIEVANKINSLFQAPIKTGDNHEFQIEFSIGISCYPKDGDKSESLMKKADMAMYHAKSQQLEYSMYYDQLKR